MYYEDKEEKMSSWKFVITTVFAIALVSAVAVLRPSTVGAGEEGVLIKKPWFFGHGGVDPVPVKTGLVWRVASTDFVRVNIKPFNIDEVFDDLVTLDNNRVDFKIHLTFKHIAGKTPILIEKFGTDWYKNKVREPLRNSTRSFTKAHTMFEMTTDPKVTDKLEHMVRTEIEKFLIKEGIPTELVLATVGRAMPPASVIAATEETAVQVQREKTQKKRVQAEKAREAAERASAVADKAYMDEMGMSPGQYLKMKELENQKAAIDGAAEGKINMNLILGGNVQPMFQVK